MSGQRLYLLGAVHVASKGDDVPRFRSHRAIALLGYLVAEGRPVRRDALCALFWPDDQPARGRGKLRRDLHNLTQVLPDCWQIDRTSVAFRPSPDTSVDIYQLRQVASHERWPEADELLSGEFLEGIYLSDNQEFETWLLGERVLTRVTTEHTWRGEYADALRCAGRLLQLSPWNEGAQHRTMRLLAWTGQRGATLSSNRIPEGE